jgi:radical SAM protein with 4Fe4S-binding SPASM domain
MTEANAAPAEPKIVGNRVELQLLTTLKCNLKCSYCSLGVGEVLRSQRHATYSADQLAAFVATHLPDKEVYITLYGGEPTLNPKFMLDLLERFPLSRFNLQTNGTLLDRVPQPMLHRLSNMMISVDGGEAVNDGFRGKGVFKKVLDNVARIRARTQASLTARVTWWSGETSFDDIAELTKSFDYVYFQFAQDEGAHGAEAKEKKQAVLAKLVERFFSAPWLLPIVPIMGAVRNKLAPSRVNELSGGLTQCRVSTNLLNVMPDGKIFPCPDMLYRKELQQGDIRENWLKKSPLQPHPAMPCHDCDAQHFCRGNCMKNLWLAYVEKQDSWRRQVTEPVCELIRFMGREIDRHDPAGWFARAPLGVREEILGAEVYEYCEVMP